MEAIGDALQRFLKSSKWQDKLIEIQLRESWDSIMGKTIAKYTHQITYHNHILTIYTNVAALKQELKMAENMVIANINQHFKKNIIKNIIVK